MGASQTTKIEGKLNGVIAKLMEAQEHMRELELERDAAKATVQQLQDKIATMHEPHEEEETKLNSKLAQVAVLADSLVPAAAEEKEEQEEKGGEEKGEEKGKEEHEEKEEEAGAEEGIEDKEEEEEEEEEEVTQYVVDEEPTDAFSSYW